MPEVKWVKITTDMFDDEKIKIIEKMPDPDSLLIIWVKLICQAGRVNDAGAIYITENLTFNEEDLATVFNRPVNVVRLALKTFQRLGMIEISNTGVILLLNWEKHQNIEGLEKIRADTRKRVATHREKQRLLTSGNVTVRYSNATEEEENRIEENREEIAQLEKMVEEKRYDEVIIDGQKLSTILRCFSGEQTCSKANLKLYLYQLKKLNIDIVKLGIEAPVNE